MTVTDVLAGPVPYYQRDGITIYHGDNRDVLPALAERFDLIVTSPPWNLGGTSNANFRNSHKRGSSRWGASELRGGYGPAHGDDMPWPEYVAWQRAVLLACWLRLEGDGAIYFNHKPVIRDKQLRLPTELIPPVLALRQIITINRGGGFNFSRTHYLPVVEWLMILAGPGFQLRDTAASKLTDLWRIVPELRTPHPAPFPPDLPARAIASTGARTVLDPYAGWGSTLVAAQLAGIHGVGIEIEERFCEMTARRLEQLTLVEAAG